MKTGKLMMTIIGGILAVIFIWYVSGIMAGSINDNFRPVNIRRSSEISNWGNELNQVNCEVRAKKYIETGSCGGVNLTRDQRSDILPAISPVESIIRLVLDYKPVKGLKNTYTADFSGDFLLQNPYNEKAYIQFYMPLPGEGGVVSDLQLLVNGIEPPDVKYELNGISWNSLFLPEESKTLNITYKARGIGRYTYSLPKSERMKKLDFELTVRGAKNIEIPSGCIPEGTRIENKEGIILSWDMRNIVTNLNIGIQVPSGNDISSFGSLFQFAPALCIMFLLAMIGGTMLLKVKIKALPVIFSTTACVGFYPLFAYMSLYIDAPYALLISIVIISCLIIGYLCKIANLYYGLIVGGISLLLFLIIPSITTLFPVHAGITLTLSSLISLVLLMVITSRHNKMEAVKQSETVYSH